MLLTVVARPIEMEALVSRRFFFETGLHFRRKLAVCLTKSVVVLSPAEWRVAPTGNRLYLVEQRVDGRWWLKGIFFNLADAFDGAELLHGPVRGLTARWAAWVARFERGSAQSFTAADNPWAGRVYQSALASNPFKVDAGSPSSANAPASAEDVARFVARRFAAAGRPRDTMAPEAIFEMVQHCDGGLPEVNQLAGVAALLADLEGAHRVARHHVKNALAIRDEHGVGTDAAQAQMRTPRAREARLSNARLTVAVAGLLIVLTSSLGAKWLLVEPMTAELMVPSAASPVQVATATPPATAIHPADPAPAVEPIADPAPRLAEAAPNAVDYGPVPQTAQPRPALNRTATGSRRFDTPRLAETANSLGLFEGPVDNQTMNRSGRLAIAITRDPGTGTIRATFHAGEGLLGTGELAGKITDDGRISASGTLMMGKNVFLCDLSGQLNGRQFLGSAEFVRPWGGRIAHSVFRLVKS